MIWWRYTVDPLRSSIFTDGQIEELERSGEALLVRFRNYMNHLRTLRFEQVADVTVSDDALVYEVMAAEFTRCGDRWHLRFLDDDRLPLLELTYATARFEDD